MRAEMPRLVELQKRLKRHRRVTLRTGTEETLIEDVRGQMRPCDFVEEKLQALSVEAQPSGAIRLEFVRRPR